MGQKALAFNRGSAGNLGDVDIAFDIGPAGLSNETQFLQTKIRPMSHLSWNAL